jgi:hypothetical protein
MWTPFEVRDERQRRATEANVACMHDQHAQQS